MEEEEEEEKKEEEKEEGAICSEHPDLTSGDLRRTCPDFPDLTSPLALCSRSCAE